MLDGSRRKGWFQKMGKPHWTIIGRDIAREMVDMNKRQRVTHTRNCAKSLGLSPHTVRRFVVLAQFVEKLGIPGSRATALHIGTMEIIYRIHDHDPAQAITALADVLRGELSYGAASKRLEKLARSNSGECDQRIGRDKVRKRIAELLDAPDPANLREVPMIDFDQGRLSRSNSLYILDDKIVSFISEAEMVASNQRGIKNLSRMIILSACESHMVVVDFSSPESFEEFQKHARSVRQDVRDRIRHIHLP